MLTVQINFAHWTAAHVCTCADDFLQRYISHGFCGYCLFIMPRDVFCIFWDGFYSFQFIIIFFFFLSTRCSCVTAGFFIIHMIVGCSVWPVEENVDALVRLVQQWSIWPWKFQGCQRKNMLKINARLTRISYPVRTYMIQWPVKRCKL